MSLSHLLIFSVLTVWVYKAWYRQGFFLLCSCSSFNDILSALSLQGSSEVFLRDKQAISCLKLPRYPQYITECNGNGQHRWGNSHFSLKCSQWCVWGQALVSLLHYFCWNTFWIKAPHKLGGTCPLPLTFLPALARPCEWDTTCPLHLTSDSPSCDEGEALQDKFKIKFKNILHFQNRIFVQL